MPHHIYQTDAFVLSGLNIGDSNKFVSVFTRDMGLVRAAAQSARREKSKLRYSLQDYSYIQISLVRGREIWRVTGASEEYSTYYKFLDNKKKLNLNSRIFSLLNRLLQGEEKNEYLFETVNSFVNFLDSNDLSDEEFKTLECVVVMRILYSLGYIKIEKHSDDMLKESSFSKKLLDDLQQNSKVMVKEINHALNASHL